MGEKVIGTVDELEEEGRLLVEVKGREIGVFKVDGEYRAYMNWCVHQGGPICEGRLSGEQKAEFNRDTLKTELEWTNEEGVIACPWHGWEFDLKSGTNISREDVELPSYPVHEKDGEIILTI